MSKRYLMRLGKTPFEAVDAFHTLDRNTLGTNNGNLVYGAASHKLFSTRDTVVDANRYKINAAMADRVNDEYDGFILPLANAFRPEFENELLRTAQFLERLTIPFLMLSGGAQLPPDGDPASLRKMEPTIRRFARAVLDGSSKLSVRGEMSAAYLRSLGFDDVVVVGCPSMTLHGPGHRVEVPDTLQPGAPIAYNLETKDPFGGDLIEDAEHNYLATYLPQEHGTLELMLWATAPYSEADLRLPLDSSHQQFASGQAEFYLDAYPWIDRLAEMDFSFGARAHGNIAAVLGGTPCVMLAHDSRTFELARYHGIPYVVRGTEPLPATVQELYALADFSEFNRGHTERFQRLSDFIHENGFEHIYDPGQESARAHYEARIRRIDFPPPVRPTWQDRPADVAHRHAVLQERSNRQKQQQAQLRRDLGRLKAHSNDQLAQLTERVDQAEKRAAAAVRRAEAAEQRAARADRKLAAIDKRVAKVSAEAQRATDRSQRAVRVPTRLRGLISRLRP